MKKYILTFVRNGLCACGFGPLVLAVIYFVLGKTNEVEVVNTSKIAVEMMAVTLLAFIAGGINVVFKIEKLPLVLAILIHVIVLYIDYFVIYLMNGWIENDLKPFLLFTVYFILGYILIWFIIYIVTKKNTDKLNEKLLELQKEEK